MRKLTIKRYKTFVGCLMMDQVYIRDEQAPEITIEGVPCRKLGNIKNGEEKTFEIGEEQQQIFLIADRFSKERCNASTIVVEGQEDVFLSGKHHFYLGSNPFRFDGVQLSEEQLAKERKKNRKGAVIYAAAVIGGFAFGAFLTSMFLKPDTPSPKTFTKEDFSITLTDAFQEVQDEKFFVGYESSDVVVFVVREDKTLFEDITLDEYSQLVLQANNRKDIKLNKDDRFVWFDYTYTQGEQELLYRAFCGEGEKNFWLITFATPAVNQNKIDDTFAHWVTTSQIG